MAVWLFASDLLGPSLFQHFHPRFMNLVWLNAGVAGAGRESELVRE
jgi:hypothetical protein